MIEFLDADSALNEGGAEPVDHRLAINVRRTYPPMCRF
jgi:hypothetical protein